MAGNSTKESCYSPDRHCQGKVTDAYGKGWSQKQLLHCLRFAETFTDEQIVSALRRQLNWTHIKTLIYIDDPLKPDFYAQIAQLELWDAVNL
ncbi:MAG TPA: hypothetical protein DCZ75_10695 [Geobacter sp.]|nr:hypothetical protein [Geobacter sp.]